MHVRVELGVLQIANGCKFHSQFGVKLENTRFNLKVSRGADLNAM